MFDFLYGWRKASKCQKLIRLIQCRLKLLKNKKSFIVRKLREDIAQLLKDGNQDVALERAGQLISEESLGGVYELLDCFCELITINFSYIRRHRDCPNDINEAISSLIFASTRCVDLLELGAIPKLFEERYGLRFVVSAMKLCPGNLVNSKVKEKLSINLVSDEMKHRMVDEITRSNNLTFEYSSELHQQQQQRKAASEQEKERVDRKSSSTESSFQFSEDAYPDEIQEFHPPTKDSSLRFFTFSSLPAVTEGETCEADEYDSWKTQNGTEHEDYYDDGSSDGSDSSEEDAYNCQSAACYSAEDGRNHPNHGALSVVEQQPHGEKNYTDNMTRPSTSFPQELPNHLSHVHPKLPDYEDIVIKFTALKKKAYRPTKQPTISQTQMISLCPQEYC